MSAVVVTAQVRTCSEANMRENHFVRAKRRKAQRNAVAIVLRKPLADSGLRPPCVVQLTRVSPRKLDGDNLQGSLKAIRDAVATELGIDDGSDDVTWLYDQKTGKPKAYGVEIRILTGRDANLRLQVHALSQLAARAYTAEQEPHPIFSALPRKPCA